MKNQNAISDSLKMVLFSTLRRCTSKHFNKPYTVIPGLNKALRQAFSTWEPTVDTQNTRPSATGSAMSELTTDNLKALEIDLKNYFPHSLQV